MPLTSLLFTLCLLALFSSATAHGAMTYPPARNTDSVDWQSANKGAQEGVWTNESTNVCGAPQYITPGPVVATFTAGQTITIDITISAYHNGYYEFRLCVPKNNGPAPATNQELLQCLLDPSTPLLKRVNPLQAGQIADYKITTPPVWTQQQLETRWRQAPQDGIFSGKMFKGQQTFSLEYRLPENVQCNNCVLHWYWQSLNSWQSGPADSMGTTTGERFWNCADIAINPKSGVTPTTPQTPTTPTASCWDGVQNQGESGVDCGGPCAACANKATCWDGIQNQGETGVDCGGPCAACTKQPTCWDGIQNQGETGVDCGGPCAPCATPSNPPTDSPAVSSCPVWSSSGKYVTNDVVTYNGMFYKCLQSHTANAAWTPTAAFTLWQQVSTCTKTNSAMAAPQLTSETVVGTTNTDTTATTGSSSDGNVVPNWGIALICLGAAIVATQLVYFIYRYRKDRQILKVADRV